MSNAVIAPNRLKQALRAGKSVIGTMLVEMRQPSAMQLLANAGFDFVIIDNEHGAFNRETVADLSRTARYVGLTPIVRVPDLSYVQIATSLDGGAQGIMAPRIYNAPQVREVVQIMKYPPAGIRGTALSRGYTEFKSPPLVESMARNNEETLLIVQIETQEAVTNLEEIMSVHGVDVTLIGPTDLSISLGVAGQMDNSHLHAAIEAMLAICQHHANVYPGIHINDLNSAVYWAKKGMRLVSSSSETGLLMKAGEELTSTIRQAFGG